MITLNQHMLSTVFYINVHYIYIYILVVCETTFEMMKNVKNVTIAPSLTSIVNSSDKQIHTLPDSSAEVNNILHIYV